MYMMLILDFHQVFPHFLLLSICLLVRFGLLVLMNIMCNHLFFRLLLILAPLHYTALASFLLLNHIVILIIVDYLAFQNICQYLSSLNFQIQMTLLNCFVLLSYLPSQMRSLLYLDLLLQFHCLYLLYIGWYLSHIHILCYYYFL